MQKYLIIGFTLMATGASAQQLTLSQKMQLQSACGADISRLCSGVARGGGRVMQCVRAKKAQLSQPCADAIATLLPATKAN